MDGLLVGDSVEELLDLALDRRRGGRAAARSLSAGGSEEVESKSTPTDLVSEADLASQR